MTVLNEKKTLKKKKNSPGFVFIPSQADKIITACIMILCIFGTIMIASATVYLSSTNDGSISSVLSNFKVLILQLAFLLAGLVAYSLLCHMFKMSFVRKYINYITYGSIGLLLLAYISTKIFFPNGIGGSYAWIKLWPSSPSIQPSEFSKVVMILMIAANICDNKFAKARNWYEPVWKELTIFVVTVLIVLIMQHDFGSAVIICGIFALCYLLPDQPVLSTSQIIVGAITLTFVTLFILLLNDSFRSFVEGFAPHSLVVTLNRFHAAVNPAFSITGESRELFNSLYGIANGGITGVGYGESIQKYGYLGAPESDYIFSIIVEELGLFGIAMIFIPYSIILIRLLSYSFLVKKQSDKVLLIGAFLYLFIHLFFNIGGVTGLMPLTGVPLLMVSSGGTSLVSVLAMLGIAQNVIARYNLGKQTKRIVQ